MLVIIEGRSLGVVSKPYEMNGQTGESHKLQILQDGEHGVVEVKVPARNAEALAAMKRLKELDRVAVECTFYAARMQPRDNGQGEYLRRESFSFESFDADRMKLRAAS